MKLIRAAIEDAEKVWKMQVKAFQSYYEKYHDETNPAAEKIEKVIARIEQPYTYYYFVEAEGQIVGAVRVVDDKNGETKRIAPIFIMEEYRAKGYGKEVLQLVEEIHGSSNWELSTILQEEWLCHFYEKMGYHKKGDTVDINERLTLVFYRKD